MWLYFHHVASSRCSMNKIFSLVHPDGFIASTNQATVDIVEEYFSQLFTSQLPDPSLMDKVGNPISPYLFLLDSEGLSSLIIEATNRQIPQKHALGLKITRNAPHISHLFFSDDSLLFSVASPIATTTIKDLLHDYSLTSGQLFQILTLLLS
ncbi:hypothetical protein G4B88_008029 [Cannabis sativa]|uniref:Reverse transcriptase domain-containing protein n=1 Tax=Cannabis sativa TaxID=3483 RepID=A0A7J6I744_CANSA|nr:hypothetical protein G4B88_008029 [Cannabis sativa]